MGSSQINSTSLNAFKEGRGEEVKGKGRRNGEKDRERERGKKGDN